MHSPRLHPEKVSTGSIASAGALCAALDLSAAELNVALALSPEERYQQREIPKKDGSTRVVNNPHFAIRKIQRRINRRIFANKDVIRWPDHIFGSVPNDTSSSSAAAKDFVNCARQHCGAKTILSVDIKDFFNNIHISQVESIFLNFLKYSLQVSQILANLCCKGEHLVQGALTSSYIATLCLFETEGRLVQKLRYKNLTYTRLVDDITISSKIANYDFSYALRQIENVLHEAGLPLNLGKTRVQNASMSPLIVHGLRVDFAQPRLPPDEPRKIRAAVKNLELLAESPGYRASRAYRKDFNRCLGRVNKLQRVEHSQHFVLLNRLRKILPLPSHNDIVRGTKIVERLVNDAKKPNYKDTYWFHKRYYVASERIAILKRSFPRVANELRIQLRTIKPMLRYE